MRRPLGFRKESWTSRPTRRLLEQLLRLLSRWVVGTELASEIDLQKFPCLLDISLFLNQSLGFCEDHLGAMRCKRFGSGKRGIAFLVTPQLCQILRQVDGTPDLTRGQFHRAAEMLFRGIELLPFVG